jgi:dTDP-4-amino-4,6-dideoxygalactose transaminase
MLANPDFIPQAQPLGQYLAHQDEIDAAIRRVLHSGWYILGQETESFEREFAAYIGTRYAVGVASGTDALVLALAACGIGLGDEVITTPHTAVATVAAIELTGATPVLVDIESDTCLIACAGIEHAISSRTKAIVPVHLFGQPADLDAILALAHKHSLRVIEDCAQAHGARYRGKRVGSCGDMACFSFYPTKNLGAIGDGGMVLTDDADLAARVRMLREYGWKQRFVSDAPGRNSRLDELQAAILRAKLPHLDADNERRNNTARRYHEGLSDSVAIPIVKADRTSVFHLYVVRADDRNALQQHLRRKGIGTAIHYPVPVHLQPAYRGRLGDKGSFPVAEQAAGEILSLPLYPELKDSQVRRVVDVVQQYPAVLSSARS